TEGEFPKSVLDPVKGPRPGRLITDDDKYSIRRLPLRHVPQAATFNQAVEILGQVGSVVPGALQSLSHQEDLKSRSVPGIDCFRQIFQKHTVADAVDVL